MHALASFAFIWRTASPLHIYKFAMIYQYIIFNPIFANNLIDFKIYRYSFTNLQEADKSIATLCGFIAFAIDNGHCFKMSIMIACLSLTNSPQFHSCNTILSNNSYISL